MLNPPAAERKTVLKGVFAACLLIANSLSVSGFQEPVEWTKFTSPEGRFSVLLPTSPKPDNREVETAIGKLTLYAYEATSKTVYFAVSFADYPREPPDAAGIEKTLDGVRDGVLKGISAELISEKKISVNGVPGRDFVAKMTAQEIEFVYNWRICLDGRRLYQFAAVSQKVHSGSPEIAKFLSSFVITKQVTR